MVNSISPSTNPLLNHSQAENKKKEYQPELDNLFDQYISSTNNAISSTNRHIENQVADLNNSSLINKTKKINKAVQSLLEKSHWKPNLKDLQVDNQIKTIKELLNVIEDETFDTENQLQTIPNNLNENIVINKNFIAMINDCYDVALKRGGGNFSILKSYQESLVLPQAQIDFDDQIKNLISKILPDLLGEIQPDTEVLPRDIDKSMDTFINSLTDENIVNDFSTANRTVKNLLTLLRDPKADIKSYIDKASKFSKQLEKRKDELVKYLEGPAKANLYLKDPDEFKIEVELLNENIKYLAKLNQQLGQTKLAFDSLDKKLRLLENYILELSDINLQFVIGQYQESSKNSLVPLYNNNPIQRLIS